MNQYGRRDCCEISGLPVEHGEDTNKLVINLGSQMGLNLTESDISVSHRLPNNNSYSSRLKQGKVNRVSQIPKLIVKFVRRDTNKNCFIKVGNISRELQQKILVCRGFLKIRSIYQRV